MPLYAYSPISLPYLLSTCAAFFCTIVTMMDAIRKARKESDVRPQLPNDIKREPWRKKARSAVRIAQPAAAMPMA